MGDGAGLWLNTQQSGAKSWVFRWSPKGGKPREMGLGSFPAVSLARARELAARCRVHVAAGYNPKTERDRFTGNTFGQVADQFLDTMAPRWTNEKTKYQWVTTLGDRCNPIRERPVSQVDTADILKILNPIWQEIPETAARSRSRIEEVLDFAKAKGWRDGENPARWRGHLANILPPRQKLTRGHHPAMAYSDLPAFWNRLNGMEALAARALELLILTATRTSEVLKATWDEFDLANGLWVIPADRMKAKRDHRIPLTSEAVAILNPLFENKISNFVFPGQKQGKPLSGMSMEMLLRRMKVKTVTVHGFRSTFRDWCGDETSFAREIAEAALAHKVGSDVEQAYRRSDALEKRRRLMETWAEYCGGVLANKEVALNA
jgi:integrase